jgi:glycosyltransferase involved in cell wall biosynthesis
MATKVWAVTVVRDEADIIEWTIRQLFAHGIDGIIAVDNLSTDDTLKILGDLARQFNILATSDKQQSYYFYQGGRMTALGNIANAEGAEWVIPFDADELFFTVDGKSIVEVLENVTADVVTIPMLNYFATAEDDVSIRNPYLRELYRKLEPNPLNKTCYRWYRDYALEPGSHHVRQEGKMVRETLTSLRIGHFQNRSPHHLIRKIRNEASGMVHVANPNQDIGYWHKFHAMTDAQILEWWRREYYFTEPRKILVHDPVPYIGV